MKVIHQDVHSKSEANPEVSHVFPVQCELEITVVAALFPLSGRCAWLTKGQSFCFTVELGILAYLNMPWDSPET